MQTYEMIRKENLNSITKEQLASMYNDAVETIWHLNRCIKKLSEENDAVWEAYEKVADELYG